MKEFLQEAYWQRRSLISLSIHDIVIHPLLRMITNFGICGLLAAN